MLGRQADAYFRAGIGQLSSRLQTQDAAEENPELTPLRDLVRGLIENGITASEAADHVLKAISKNEFWIRTHAEMEPGIAARCAAIAAGEAPPLMIPKDIK